MTARSFEIESLDHLVLRTKNLSQLVTFYEDLGCTVVRSLEQMGLVQLRAGRSMIDLLDVEGEIAKKGSVEGAPGGGRNLDHFALRINPFDASQILAFCVERGIEAQCVPMPLLGADGFGPAVYIQDPDGNRVELKGPPNDDPIPDGL